MRGFHLIKRDHVWRYPSDMVFVDTETSTITDTELEHIPTLKVGVAQYVKLDYDLKQLDYAQLVFYTPAEFWRWIDFITSKTESLNIYAHNWAFDYPVLEGFRYMKLLGYELKKIIDASPPILITYRKKGSTVRIIDTLNYFRQSLDSMGKSLNVSKLKIDFNTCSMKELTVYCKRDVDITRLAVLNLIRFLHSNKLCGLKPTVASLAMASYKNRFMHHSIQVDGDEDRVALTRESYFGGRTECFFIGKKRSKHYLIDVNSMYPFVMRNNDYPVSTFAWYKNISVSDLEQLTDRYCITARVGLRTNIGAYPKIINQRTCFPVGSFKTLLSTPEIVYALNNGHIKEVYDVVLHYKAPIFRAYVDFFYTKRREYKDQGNDMYQDFAKKLLNSLYGKFGQQHESWVKVDIKPREYDGRWFEYDADLNRNDRYMQINGVVYYCENDVESNDSYPAIAAHVTSHARMVLQLTKEFIGHDHCLYCDTDSLLIDQTGYNRMIDRLDSKTLGCWSLDGTYDEIEIRGAKDYRFGSKEKIKGVRKSRITDEAGNVIYTDDTKTEYKYDYIQKSEGVYKVTQFRGLKGVIKSGNLNHTMILNKTKTLKREYHKGFVGIDGRVTPIPLAEF